MCWLVYVKTFSSIRLRPCRYVCQFQRLRLMIDPFALGQVQHFMYVRINFYAPNIFRGFIENEMHSLEIRTCFFPSKLEPHSKLARFENIQNFVKWKFSTLLIYYSIMLCNNVITRALKCMCTFFLSASQEFKTFPTSLFGELKHNLYFVFFSATWHSNSVEKNAIGIQTNEK